MSARARIQDHDRQAFHYVGQDPIHPIHRIQLEGRSNVEPRAGLRSLGIPRQLRGFKSRTSCTGVHKFKFPSISRMAS